VIAARNLNLLPQRSYIQSFHKRSLRSLQEDVEDSVLRTINLETGEIVIKEPQDQWDVTDSKLAKSKHEYHYGDFMTFETTEQTDERLRKIRDSMYEDRKNKLQEQGINAEKLLYNKHSRYFSPDHPWAAPPKLDSEAYAEGKAMFVQMKSEYAELNCHDFLDAVIFEKTSDLDGLDTLKEKEQVRQENLQELGDVDIAAVLMELREMKQGLLKGSDNLSEFSENMVEKRIFGLA
jgi:hypothetical protein